MEENQWHIHDERRIKVAKQWVDAAYDVVDKTKDEQATELATKYLYEYSVGHDTPKGVRVVHWSKESNIVFVPVLEEDKGLAEDVDAIISESASLAANYAEGNPGFLSVDGYHQISGDWMGLIVLHELIHAQAFDIQMYRGDDYKEFGHWREEVDAFSFENRLMSKIGGQNYEKYVNEQLKRFLREFDDSEIETKGIKVPKIDQVKELEHVFGPSKSKREVSVRSTATWIDIMYRLIDLKYGKDSLNDKVAFTKAVYAMGS